jgi:Uma2 family endonuclease
MTETRFPNPAREALPETPVSYEEFLAWADEDIPAEWIDGEIHVTSPASSTHQRLVRFLSNIINVWLEQCGEGALFVAPFQMKLDRGREPDLLVVQDEHRNRIQETHLDGPADFVVEVVSAESGARDRGEKFYEYEKAGIPEYWLVDPQREELTLYRLRDGRYRTAVEGHEGRAESEVLEGFWIEAEWLWQEELPAVLSVLRRWELI